MEHLHTFSAFSRDTLPFSLDQALAMGHNSPPPSGSQALARAKRRRTSPEDQAILEAAFQKNAKPDKAERAELLSRVSLGEKELSVCANLSHFQDLAPADCCSRWTRISSFANASFQIWFQNRRQVSRRRSRPLTSDDVLSQQQLSSSFSLDESSQDAVLSQESTSASSQTLLESEPVQQSNHVGSRGPVSKDDGLNTTPSSTGDTTLAMSSAPLPHVSDSEKTKELPALSTSTSVSDDSIRPISKPLKASKKKPDACFTLYDESQSDVQSVAPCLPVPTKRKQSQPRLATSLDGSVRVRTGNSPTPSPPRPRDSLFSRQPRASGPLQRSQSAIVTPTFPLPRSTASIGRSRDSRTWEFYCDPNARDELTKQAEREQSGSAVGAIGLIRSCSKGSLSAGSRPTNPHKRNATASKPDSGKRLKADTSIKTSKPKLARATSSIARLQNPRSLSKMSNANKSTTPVTANNNSDSSKKKKPTYTDLLDGNESDKENWAPGTQTSVTPRRTKPNTPQTNILTENQHLPSLSSSLDVLLSRDSSGNARHPRRGNKMGTRVIDLEAGKRGQENERDGSDDDGVREFMTARNGSGSGENVIVGGDGDEEDLDCVEGLLKLSRGDWR
ncbi:MAG: hypothetical protein Q9169_005313 [Polycauliona sp. 2 TL-2023]